MDLNEWVTSWLQHLLSREMKFEDIVRLWGKYLNNSDIITITLVRWRLYMLNYSVPILL